MKSVGITGPPGSGKTTLWRAVTGGDEDVPYVQQEDARFCTSCWRGLTPAQVEQVGREVALRGVPL